jgi:hypothetical protein
MIDRSFLERDVIFSHKTLDLSDHDFSHGYKPSDDELDKYFDISMNNREVDGENESENIASERIWLMKV